MEENRQISEREKSYILKRDKHTCRYCGDKTGPFEFDHVYPYSKGGETSARNIVLACTHCNRVKHNAVGVWPLPIEYFDKFIEKGTYKFDQEINIFLVAEMFVSLGLINCIRGSFVGIIEIVIGGILIVPQVVEKARVDFYIMKESILEIVEITKEVFNEET